MGKLTQSKLSIAMEALKRCKTSPGETDPLQRLDEINKLVDNILNKIKGKKGDS